VRPTGKERSKSEYLRAFDDYRKFKYETGTRFAFLATCAAINRI
jgi:hypothetical protein